MTHLLHEDRVQVARHMRTRVPVTTDECLLPAKAGVDVSHPHNKQVFFQVFRSGRAPQVNMPRKKNNSGPISGAHARASAAARASARESDETKQRCLEIATQGSAEAVIHELQAVLKELQLYKPSIHPDGSVLAGVDLQRALHVVYDALRVALLAMVNDDLVYNQRRTRECDLDEVMQVLKEKMGYIAVIHSIHESGGGAPDAEALKWSYAPMLSEAITHCYPQLEAALKLYRMWL